MIGPEIIWTRVIELEGTGWIIAVFFWDILEPNWNFMLDNIKPFRYRHIATDLNMADLVQTGCFKDNERARKE